MTQLALITDHLAIDEAEWRRDRAVGAEYYRTQAWVVESLLLGGGPQLPGGMWLDPCAGEGAIPQAVNRVRSDVGWQLCELREECRPALEQVGKLRTDGLVLGDFLAEPSPVFDEWPADVVIFNSPFTLTVRFVERAWEHGAWVVSLQRQSFVGYARANWLSQHMPDRYVLPDRPSFRPDGRKDAAEYEWHVWPPDGRYRDWGLTRMLAMPGQGQLDLEASQ